MVGRSSSLSVILTVLMITSAFVVLISGPSSTGMLIEDASLMNSAGSSYNGVSLDSSRLSTMSGVSKIDNALIEKMESDSNKLRVQVLVADRQQVNDFLGNQGLPLVAGIRLPGLPDSRIMELTPSQIAGLAKNPGVFRIMDQVQPVLDVVPIDSESAIGPITRSEPISDDYDAALIHGAYDAWSNGYTGSGVKVAIIDTGFDLAHPDLQGQQARNEDPTSPYFGWPIAYDDWGATLWSGGTIGSWIADTTATSADMGGYVAFDGRDLGISALKDVMGVPVQSQSGVYHVGYHTDANLWNLWGEMINVLVVDTATPGVYDTVYVDVDDDWDFSNDKPCTMGDEISYFDFFDSLGGTEDWSAWNAGDGFADLSGGMIYWISDGTNVYPASDWLYGADFVPGSGDAVAFVGEFSLGNYHGTWTASAALATGASLMGLLNGIAPDAKLIPIPWTGDFIAEWIFAEFGVDGFPNTGDEANIVSNSYGFSSETVHGGYDIYSMYASLIPLIGGDTLWTWSTGNGGPGYGTQQSPYSFEGVHVGAGTSQQYRYWIGPEVAYEYAKWGDVVPFSNSGPSRTGKVGTEIIASGHAALTTMPLNEWSLGGLGDGYWHYSIFAGTSLSSPLAAGGAALGYQAYSDTHGGTWPSMDLTKAKLMASADDMRNDPFKQGAGWMNLTVFTEIMAETSGTDSLALSGMNEPVYTKAALYPGFVYGERYEDFVNLLLPGEYDDTHIIETSNHDPVNPVTVDVSSKMLMLTGSTQLDYVTSNSGSIIEDITSLVPLGTDLMRATFYMPYEEFDAGLDYWTDYLYYLEMHDWVDLNLNGTLDITGNDWELFRFMSCYAEANYQQITLKDPLDRINDGLIMRLRSVIGGAGLSLSVRFDFFELQEFPWVSFREVGDTMWTQTLSIPIGPGSAADWEVNVSIPGDAYVGTYGAGIYVDDGSRVQNIPVVMNVAASEYEFEFGDWSYFDTTYNNEITGIGDKSWRFEVGDWRMYWAMPSAPAPSENSYLIVDTSWSWSDPLTTDVNTHVLGPVTTDWPTFMPPFGPGLVEVAIASSNEMYMGEGIFGIYTSTGTSQEIVSAPLGTLTAAAPAPFMILTRCPVMSGYSPTDTFYGVTSWITLNAYAPDEVILGPIPSAPTSSDMPAWYNVTLPGPVEVSGGGTLPMKREYYPAEEIWQDSLSADFFADLANAAYTRPVQISGHLSLWVGTAEVADCPDIDLGVWFDTDMDGVAELSEPFWYSGTSASSETVSIDLPSDGQYLVKVLGYSVLGMPGLFELTIRKAILGYVEAVNFDSPVDSGYHEFTVSWQLWPTIQDSGEYEGWATWGFYGTSDMFSIHVLLNVDMDPPEIQDLYPADSSVIGASSLTVSYFVNDSVTYYSGLDPWSVQMLLDDFWWFGWGEATVVGDSVYFDIPLALSDGRHTIEVWAADTGGNWAYSSSTIWINSQIERFAAEWVDPGTMLVIRDGARVNLTDVMLRGYTDPLASVDMVTPLTTYSIVADDTGYYEQNPVTLVEGLNIVTVSTTNNGSVSASMLKMIVSDTYCMLWVNDVDSPTSSSVAAVTGWTDADATVMVNGLGVSVRPDGTFSADVNLTEGLNTIVIDATDSVGNSAQELLDVWMDTTPPALAIIGPADGSNVSEPSVWVFGSTDAGASVWVNGVVASNGSAEWGATIVLSEGINNILVIADDGLGNMATASLSVEYIPPDYVTPDELAAAQAELAGMVNNLSAALAENVTALQGDIADLASSLAENVSNLQSDLIALEAALAENVTLLEAQIDDLDAALLENATALQADIDMLEAALAENVTELNALLDALAVDLTSLSAAHDENVTALNALIAALESSLGENVSDLQNQIDGVLANITVLQTSLVQEVADLQSQIVAVENSIDDLTAATDASVADLQDQMDQLEQEMTTGDDDIQQQVDDVDAFANMLMYLTLILFAIAIVLVALVWYMVNNRMKASGSGGAPAALEEVAEPPSDVEKEFEELEKEIKKEES